MLATLLVLSIAALSTGQAGSGAEFPSLQANALGAGVDLQIAPLETTAGTRDALVAALEEINELDSLIEAGLSPEELSSLPPDDDGVRSFEVDGRVLLLLERSLAYCQWSQQAHGPLGGRLYRLWGFEQAAFSVPPMAAMQPALASAQCSNLRIDDTFSRAALVGDSQIELWGFARGFAVDRAVEVLKERGATNGWVRIGHTMRAFGPGTGGFGWPATAPVSTDGELVERIYLRDRSLSMASTQAGTLVTGDKEWAPYLDQRTGRPVEGKLAVLVVSERAFDAEAMAVSLFVMSIREGEHRLGSVEPAPAVKWFFGSGEGRGLISERGWAQLPKWEPARLDGR